MIRIIEYTSAQIVNKSRNSDKFSRFNNRTNVSKINVSRVGLLDIKEGSKDLNIYFHVTSASDSSKQYRVDLKLIDFIDHLKEFAVNLDTNVTIQKLIQNLRPFFNQELKTANVKVSCSCPDFTYRFKDSARNEKFYFGIDSSDEARNPNPNKINPHYEGSVCKHLVKLLTKPSLWYEKVIRSLSNVLKNQQSVLTKTLEIPQQ
jgi:hypothetical protein